ncbi:MAG: M23 family metallopeptidase [Myxococcales bacterium]|nr:M23 family metallopeptidase [Myxococcales bacterium]
MNARLARSVLTTITATSMLLVSAESLACYVMPFTRISDPWGCAAACGRSSAHRGVDFPAPTGTVIPSISAGTVALVTTSSCLGNVLVIRNDDGMYAGYSHLSAVLVAPGATVARGQHVARVGNTGTCTTGPHLHLTLGAGQNSWYTGATVDPVAYIMSHTTCNRAPRGYVDATACTGITGWAQDEDTPNAPISVHIYLDGSAGDPAAYSFATPANLHRDDLCMAIGSCAHGFNARLPPSFFDGRDHRVFAYGIDAMGGPNPQLMRSGGTVRCDASALMLADGVVRRRLPDAMTMSAWRLTNRDVAPRTDAEIEAIPNAASLSATPALVRIEGADRVYVREFDILRPINNSAAFDAWRFRTMDVRVTTSQDVANTITGAPWPDAPLLVKGTSADPWMIDAPPPLWAEVVRDTIPARIEAGGVAMASVRLRNRGWIALDDRVTIAPTPRDTRSVFCDRTWDSCTRIGAVALPAERGQETTVSFVLQAPANLGPQRFCLGITRNSHWFSDPGQNGPADTDHCWTIQVVAAGSIASDGGVRDGSPAPGDGAPGCACSTPAAPSTFPRAPWVIAALALATARERRRNRTTA